MSMPASETEAAKSLTNREQQIAALIRSGLPNKAIANQLALAEGTVKQHIHNIFLKLAVRKRGELAKDT